MKKLFIILICFVLITFCTSNTFSQTQVYDLQEDFSSDVSSWGFVLNSGGTQNISYNSVNKLLQVRFPNLSSEYLKTLSTAITPGIDNKVTIELIVKTYTSGNSSNEGVLYFLDESGNAITGFHIRRANVGGSNKWTLGRTTSYPGTTFAYPTNADQLNADQATARIIFVLDFNAKTLDFSAEQGTFDYTTRVFTAGGATVSSTAQPFINAAATNIKTLSSWYWRGSNASGTNGYDLMYTGISALRQVSTADVTVKFRDQESNYFKTDEIVTGQVENSTYNATFDQKSSVKIGGFYYVLKSTSPTSVVVNTEGSTLTLEFTKAPYYSTMIWNGTTGTNTDIWSEFDMNFINGVSPTAYQKDANLTFDASAENKAVILNENLLMGSSTVAITSTGYNISGAGSLNGTGNLNINLSGTDAVSLGVTNNLTGTTQISGGTITVNKSLSLGITPNITGATTIISGVGQSFPAMTFSASGNIQGGNNVNSIGGMSAPSGVKIAISSSHNTNNDYAFDFAANGTLSTGSELELNGTGTTENKFGMTSEHATYLANTKVNLLGKAFLFIDANQGSASTINVGTLSGESGTKLGWGKSSALDRHITWSVGANNENSEFAGTITNLGGYAGSGSFYTGQYTHLTKVGTGKLTLSGTSNAYNGNLTVNGGEVLVSGTLQGNNQPGTDKALPNTVTVAPNAKLTVTGSLTATDLVINSDANGTGTFVNTGTTNIQGTATISQHLPVLRNWYMSPPVTSTTPPTGYTYHTYDEVSNVWVEATELVKGKGYAVTPTETGNITFTGAINDGDVAVDLTRTDTHPFRGFNLVGNPYPSYITWTGAIAASANTETTIWYRTHNGTNYDFYTYNASGTGIGSPSETTGVIAPMQAFWVRANTGGGTLTFTNSMRSHNTSGTPNLLKVKSAVAQENTAVNQILRLQVTNGTNKDETVLYFNPNASDVYDKYDSPKMSNNNDNVPEVYTKLGQENIVINGMNTIPYDTEIALGFKTGITGTFTIKANEISNFSNETNIILIDKTEGKQTDLRLSDYTFTSDSFNATDRFSILFPKSGVPTSLNSQTSKSYQILAKENRIIVNISSEIVEDASLSIYNIAGQLMKTQLINNQNTVVDGVFSAGVYIVNISNGADAIQQKIVVK